MNNADMSEQWYTVIDSLLDTVVVRLNKRVERYHYSKHGGVTLGWGAPVWTIRRRARRKTVIITQCYDGASLSFDEERCTLNMLFLHDTRHVILSLASPDITGDITRAVVRRIVESRHPRNT